MNEQLQPQPRPEPEEEVLDLLGEPAPRPEDAADYLEFLQWKEQRDKRKLKRQNLLSDIAHRFPIIRSILEKIQERKEAKKIKERNAYIVKMGSRILEPIEKKILSLKNLTGNAGATTLAQQQINSLFFEIGGKVVGLQLLHFTSKVEGLPNMAYTRLSPELIRKSPLIQREIDETWEVMGVEAEEKYGYTKEQFTKGIFEQVVKIYLQAIDTYWRV